MIVRERAGRRRYASDPRAGKRHGGWAKEAGTWKILCVSGLRGAGLTIKGAQEDVDLVSRQTSVVQTALGEQMRATRNEHVIEAVRLPELVAQSLEIVPDACRSRLEIKMDESLRRVGVVRIARTVLRLVLQNFLINASDSVREAGKVQGHCTSRPKSSARATENNCTWNAATTESGSPRKT